jgi:hypothetical protein
MLRIQPAANPKGRNALFKFGIRSNEAQIMDYADEIDDLTG